MEFKINEYCKLPDVNTEVWLRNFERIDIKERGCCLILIMEGNEKIEDIWTPKQIFELLEDGIKFRHLKRAEKIKNELKS